MKRLLITGMLLLFAMNANATSLPCGGSGTRQVAAGYTAVDGKQLEACFDLERKKVVVRLPDAQIVSLPAAISASGARYSDDKHTFWEHQGVGRYFVGEKLLFEGKFAPVAGYNGGVTSKLLKQTTVTANGQKISYPVTDKAEVSAYVVQIAPGAETGWHKHSIPVYAYMLSGELEVQVEEGSTIIYKAGDAIIEVVNTFHTGKNRGTVPASLVVFYIGVQGQPHVIRK
jgi:quercetin dioxygenase-like cupin family protein